jgi:hypothetical protein
LERRIPAVDQIASGKPTMTIVSRQPIVTQTDMLRSLTF